MTQHQETIEGMASYAVGGAGITIASLADISSAAQSITIILACMVVAVRLVHDAVRLFRYINNREK